MRPTTSFALVLGIMVLAVAAAACGGGSKTSSKPSSTQSSSTPTTTAASSPSGGAALSSGPVHATLRGTNHDPVAGKNWFYTVTASDAAGHPLAGTVLTEFDVAGQVEGRESPPTHRLKNGRLKDVIQFPARSVGIPLTLQTVVRTQLGTATLDWPVTVKR
jgi:hypothetical protein